MFLILPEEIWICILHEWIGELRTLSAFDIALCNRSLRPQYLSWLIVLKRLLNIHFDILHNCGKCEKLLKCCFYWCTKRAICPISMSYFFVPMTKSNDLLKMEQDMMKRLEYFEASFGYANTVNDTVFDILNNCLFLKHLKLTNANETYSQISIVFNYGHGPYLLRALEVKEVKFLLSNGSFQEFVRQCPLLEEVKVIQSEGMSSSHILFLLKHGKCLKSLYVDFIYQLFDWSINAGEIQEVLLPQELESNEANLVMRSLTLINVSFGERKLLVILKQCPRLQTLSIDVVDEDDDFVINDQQNITDSTAEWCEVIATCWKSLQSLIWKAPSSLSTLLRQSTIQKAIAKCCGAHLKTLHVQSRITLDLLVWICDYFIALEDLSFLSLEDGINFERLKFENVMSLFQQAKWRETLHSIEWKEINMTFEGSFFHSVISCFPALKYICFHDVSYNLMKYPLSFEGRGYMLSHLQEITLKDYEVINCAYSFLPLEVEVLQTMVNIKRLTFVNYDLTIEMLQTIVTLPNLQYFTFERKDYYDNAIVKDPSKLVFHPDNFSFQSTVFLCPLKEFKCTAGGKFSFTFDMIRAFIQKFTTLTLFLGSCTEDVDEIELGLLNREFRHRTTVSAVPHCYNRIR